MRSCAYCGRDLGPNEKCTCRSANNATNSHTTTETNQQENTSYKTDKTKTKKGFKFKKPNFNNSDFRNDAKAVRGFTKRFVFDPINTVSNPGYLSTVQTFLIIVITAAAMGFCGFFIAARYIAGFDYSIITLLKSVLTGLISGTVSELIFIGILYLINKLILRKNTNFLTFAVRPVVALIPLMLFALLGSIGSLLSVSPVMFLIAGFCMNIILTYEGMRSEWNFAPAARVMYMLGFSYFVFSIVMFNLIKLF